MSRARDLANLLDATGDVVADALDNAPPSQGKNLILNGSMQVAQRGTSYTGVGFGTVDRWQVIGNTGSITQTQEALSSGDPYDVGFRNFVRITNTDVVTNSTSAYRIIPTLLEAQDLANSGWNYTSSSSYVTLSFWVRSSVAQTYYAFIRTFDGTSSNYVIPFTLSANTWTKVTETISGDSAVQFANDNGQGLQVLVAPYWGTDFTDSGVPTNQWRTFSGSARVPDMTSTWADTDEATFDLTGVQLEVGSVATSFEHRSYGEELALCQRYYIEYRGTNNVYWMFSGITDAGYLHISTGGVFPTEMRAAPSVTIYSVSGDGYVDAFGRGQYGQGNAGATENTPMGFNTVNLQAGGGSATGNAGAIMRGGYRADAEL